MNPAEKERTVGSTPAGASDRESAAKAVREMFTSIAPRYDLLNHVLSFNIDRLWWWRTARRFDAHPRSGRAPAFSIFAAAPETWPLPCSAALARESARILGADFSHAMLQRASEKGTRRAADNDAANTASLRWVEADALRLPFPDRHFDLITSAFGFRNLADYDAGLREIARVLRPGGECGILDFGEPRGMLGAVYRVYFKKVLPAIGTVISGVSGPYAYLPASVERFPAPDEMLARMKQAGFAEASWTPYTFGVAGLYWGKL